MLARALAILLGVVPVAAAWVAVEPLAFDGWRAWSAPAIALALASVLIAMRRHAIALASLAGVLSAASGLAIGEGRSMVTAAQAYEAADVIDLTQGPMPATPPRFVAVRGRPEPRWVLDEYAVAKGAHPDQSKPAEAVLVPLLGDAPSSGPLVVVRIEPAEANRTEVVTLRGRAEPLAPALLATFRSLGHVGRSDTSAGVLVDTFEPPTPGRGWTAIALGLLAAAAALGCAWWAARPTASR